MIQELVHEIYQGASIDWASAEKAAYAMLQFLERKLPSDDYAHIQKYILGYHSYVLPPATAYVGYDDNPPDQAETGRPSAQKALAPAGASEPQS